MGCSASSEGDTPGSRSARRRARDAVAAQRRFTQLTAAGHLVAIDELVVRSQAEASAAPPAGLRARSGRQSEGASGGGDQPPQPRSGSPVSAHAAQENPLAPAGLAHAVGAATTGRTSPGFVVGCEPSADVLFQRQYDMSVELEARGMNDDVDQFCDEVQAADRKHRFQFARDVSRQAMVHSWVCESSASPAAESTEVLFSN